ncbi:MAG TPA: hypothetical protein DCK83_00535 [Gallionellaceae bacterium]|nr:hypothetical protein [Gallionellaceae bacterium]
MDAKFTLQVNDSGAWRNVLRGTSVQLMDIENQVAIIASVMGKGYKWRIIDAAMGDVIGYCNAPDFIWTPAK